MDIVAPKVRSRMMAGIRGADTGPERIIRRGLHCAGFRFRLHQRYLPGNPDLVLARYHAVIFVHGCFWHRHGCHLFRWPRTRKAFWKTKLTRNHERDLQSLRQLKAMGWRVGVVWECELRGAGSSPERVCRRLAKWLKSDEEVWDE